jgi:prepilin-type N-terminal cleavage/methylation domain-containing protein
VKKRPAFTLIELLVVIVIIGILIALIVPAVQAAREAARRSSCQNNLRQIGIALHHYHNAYSRFPSGWIADAPEGEPGWGWASLVLPYMEQTNIQNLVNYSGHIDATVNARARQYKLPNFFCPSDNAGQLGVFVLKDDAARDDPHDHGHLPIKIAAANYVGIFGTVEVKNPG